jgi:hypothetical protein
MISKISAPVPLSRPSPLSRPELAAELVEEVVEAVETVVEVVVEVTPVGDIKTITIEGPELLEASKETTDLIKDIAVEQAAFGLRRKSRRTRPFSDVPPASADPLLNAALRAGSLAG